MSMETRMQFQRFAEGRFQLRLEMGDEVLESLTSLAEREALTFATFSGLGAASSARIAFFDVAARQYETHDFDEQVEVVSLTGNLALRDGKPFVHAHAALGRRDLSVIGGHVVALVARPTIEIELRPENAQIARLLDEESGLALLSLSDRL